MKDPNSIYSEVSILNDWRSSNDFLTSTDDGTIDSIEPYILDSSKGAVEGFVRKSLDDNKKYLVLYSMTHECVVNLKDTPNSTIILSDGATLNDKKITLKENSRGYAIIEL